MDFTRARGIRSHDFQVLDTRIHIIITQPITDDATSRTNLASLPADYGSVMVNAHFTVNFNPTQLFRSLTVVYYAFFYFMGLKRVTLKCVRWIIIIIR